MFPHYLANLEVQICGNIQKPFKTVSHLTKTETSLVITEYCHNSCLKCPPFARTHARGCPRFSSIALPMMV